MQMMTENKLDCSEYEKSKMLVNPSSSKKMPITLPISNKNPKNVPLSKMEVARQSTVALKAVSYAFPFHLDSQGLARLQQFVELSINRADMRAFPLIINLRGLIKSQQNGARLKAGSSVKPSQTDNNQSLISTRQYSREQHLSESLQAKNIRRSSARPRPLEETEETSITHCYLCNLTFESPVAALKHYNSRNHIAKLPEDRTVYTYECKTCNETWTVADDYLEHLKSPEHVCKRLEKERKIQQRYFKNEDDSYKLPDARSPYAYECLACNRSWKVADHYIKHLTSPIHIKRRLIKEKETRRRQNYLFKNTTTNRESKNYACASTNGSTSFESGSSALRDYAYVKSLPASGSNSYVFGSYATRASNSSSTDEQRVQRYRSILEKQRKKLVAESTPAPVADNSETLTLRELFEKNFSDEVLKLVEKNVLSPVDVELFNATRDKIFKSMDEEKLKATQVSNDTFNITAVPGTSREGEVTKARKKRKRQRSKRAREIRDVAP